MEKKDPPIYTTARALECPTKIVTLRHNRKSIRAHNNKLQQKL